MLISESSSLSLIFSPVETKKLTRELLEKSGAIKMEDLVAISKEKLRTISDDIFGYNNFAERDGNILSIDLYEAYKSWSGKDIDMLLGSNKDENRYFIQSMGDFTNLLKGKFLFIHEIPVLFENDLKKISDKDIEYIDKFMELQSGRRAWKVAEFYNEIIFRVPMNKQAEYHSDVGGNTYVYIWKYPGKDKTLGAFHAIEISYVFNNNLDKIYLAKNLQIMSKICGLIS